MNKMPQDLIIEDLLGMPGLEDVREELANPYYINRQHGTPKTYGAGCRGPLCRKANREAIRRRRKRRADRVGYVPKTHYLKYDRDDLFDVIVEWHRDKMLARKEMVLEEEMKKVV